MQPGYVSRHFRALTPLKPLSPPDGRTVPIGGWMPMQPGGAVPPNGVMPAGGVMSPTGVVPGGGVMMGNNTFPYGYPTPVQPGVGFNGNVPMTGAPPAGMMMSPMSPQTNMGYTADAGNISIPPNQVAPTTTWSPPEATGQAPPPAPADASFPPPPNYEAAVKY